jgi:hypothetical protein
MQSPDKMREEIKGRPDELATYNRMAEHLAANGIDLEKTPATLGAVVKMNPGTEQFMQDKKANRLLRRPARPGYAIALT